MSLVCLGSAYSFALLAYSTITNTGSTNIYGGDVEADMGLFPGTSITGFLPGVIDGNTYTATDSAEAARADAQIAYTDAASQTTGTTMTGINLSGLSLAPGVYTWASSALLSAGDLYLDAGGDADAVWVFQLGSTLTVMSGTSMYFTNGVGNQDNVFWQVGSSATIGTYSSVIGNIYALASITVTTGAAVNGHLVALNGAITLDTNSIRAYPLSTTGGSRTCYLEAYPVAVAESNICLGSGYSFALLAYSTITNTGSTNIYGVVGDTEADMGLFPGTSITGFLPGVIDGNTYAGTTEAEAARADAQIAYDDAASRTTGTTMTGIDLSGLSLAPGVYTWASSALLSAGDFYLDAGGDADAVWVFQLGSTLTVASYSSMYFTDGVGNQDNVFWQVGSSATLGTYSSVIGNIYALASVTVTTGATVNGHLIALNGAITLDTNTIRAYPLSTTGGSRTCYLEAYPESTAGSRTCFSSEDFVKLESTGEEVPFRLLGIGDRILSANRAGETSYAGVVFLPHGDNDTPTTFVEIKTGRGKVIKMTRRHLLPVCSGELMVAQDIEIGACLRTIDGHEIVAAVAEVEVNGVYTAVTENEFLVVNGIIASPFASPTAIAHAMFNASDAEDWCSSNNWLAFESAKDRSSLGRRLVDVREKKKNSPSKDCETLLEEMFANYKDEPIGWGVDGWGYRGWKNPSSRAQYYQLRSKSQHSNGHIDGW